MKYRGFKVDVFQRLASPQHLDILCRFLLYDVNQVVYGNGPDQAILHIHNGQGDPVVPG
ncbi:hypothetical protein D3C77_616200 [compost metagenome]